MGRIETPEDFGKVVIANVNGVPVRVRDIGRVEDAEEEARSLARLDGTTAVSLIVQKQSGTNTVDVIPGQGRTSRTSRRACRPASRVRSCATSRVHPRLGAHRPGALGAWERCWRASVVLLFMGSFRSTLIAAVAIPTSLIATYILMDTAGFTLNNMTLLGLALGGRRRHRRRHRRAREHLPAHGG
jgi:HAE1 family hydrophobic/amphiphilic exporter-1